MTASPFHSVSRFHSRAFSLIELLTVIAIISILTALAASTINREGNALKSGLIRMSNLIESARQYAIAQNGYTYILFSEPDTTTGISYAAVVVSKTGLDIAPFGTRTTVTEGTDFEFIGRMESFEGINFLQQLPTDSTLSIPDATPFSDGTATFKLTRKSKVTNDTFTRMIKFTPRAEARVAAGLLERVQIVLQPNNGGTVSKVSSQRVSAVQISGLTGKIQIYQP